MALAALLLPIGAIGDRWGRKPVLSSGLVVVRVANMIAGLATTTTMLLVARIVAGVGGGDDHAGHAVGDHVELPDRASAAKAVGMWAGFAGAGGILGLFVSSFLIDNFTWPWVFAMPIVLRRRLAGADAARRSATHVRINGGRFDTVGSVLSALAIGGLVLGIHEGPEQGWTDAPDRWRRSSSGSSALVGFVAWELRHERPAARHARCSPTVRWPPGR